MQDQPPPSHESSPRQGISLDELTAAYAKAMEPREGTGADDAFPGQEVASVGEAGSPSVDECHAGESDDRADRDLDTSTVRAEDADAEVGDVHDFPEALDQDRLDEQHDPACELSPKTILEAMLFVGNRENDPLPSERAAGLMRGVEPGDIPEFVDQLNSRYQADGCPYRIVSQGAGYRLVLGEDFTSLRNMFYGRVREARLSQAAIEVLSAVAYRQPLTSEQVSGLRGMPSGHLLLQLVRRQLLRIERPSGKGRTAYYTTDRFLELFGLESLDDMPQPEEPPGM